jgi:hypothetical protein
MAIPWLPEPDMSGGVARTLSTLAEERLLEPAREAGYELALLGATVLPQKQTIAKTEKGTWLFVDHLEDPTAKEYGGRLPIPAEPLAYLAELDRKRVFPQLIWMGHDLGSDYKDGDPIPKLVPPPPHLRDKDERLKDRLTRASELFIAGVRTMFVAPHAALDQIGVDPIVFGGVRHPRLPIVAWCALCAWEWE